MGDYVSRLIENAKNEQNEYLDLRKLDLFEFPEKVLSFTWVKELDLSSDYIINNRSALIDEEFWWEVSFDNNAIASLPENIVKLRMLETLKLNQIELQQLPNNIGNLPNLKVLELRNNLLSKLPKGFEKLNNLEYLDLSFNLFEKFPDEILGCKNLKYLNIGSNKIKSIPPEIETLSRLENFDFSNFNIKHAFPETIERFELCNNTISKLPAEIANLSKLENVGFEWNPLDEELYEFLSMGYKLSEWFK